MRPDQKAMYAAAPGASEPASRELYLVESCPNS